MKINYKQTALALAVTAVLGVPAAASATLVDSSFSGAFTWVTPTGAGMVNTAAATSSAPWYGSRTPITGTLRYDTTTGLGTATVMPFQFLGDTTNFLFKAHNINFMAIGNGQGGPGTLLLGNMGFDWNGSVGIPVSIVMDAAGLFSANPSGMSSADIGTVITGVGALPATNGLTANGANLTLGASPIATTTWNTTSLCTPVKPGDCLGINPSGGLQLMADTVGGSPMIDGPFIGHNFNFDITSMTVTNVVPVPAAVWLLGSGLLGLVGVGRRKRPS